MHCFLILSIASYSNYKESIDYNYKYDLEYEDEEPIVRDELEDYLKHSVTLQQVQPVQKIGPLKETTYTLEYSSSCSLTTGIIIGLLSYQ